jgi:hypothetical protein
MSATWGHPDVDLVQSDEPRPIFQPTVCFEFGFDDIKISDRVPSRLIGGAVDHMDDRGATFVAQEVEAESASSLAPAISPGTSATVN